MATILVVDDRSISREVLTILLSGQGYQTIDAENGVKALEVIHNNSIDLIITDIIMPEMDGLMLAKELKTDRVLSKLPIIIYSAADKMPDVHQLSNVSNVKSILTKPCDPEIILKTIAEILNSREEAYSSNPPLLLRGQVEQIQAGNIEDINKFKKINLRLTNLIEISLDMSLQHDIEKLAYVTCKRARQFLDACYCGMTLKNLKSQTQYQTFNINKENNFTIASSEIKSPSGLLKELLLGESPICVHSPILDFEKIGLPDISLPITSFLSIPLHTARGHYGHMYFINKNKNKFFNISDERFMMTLADKFAINYENIIFYQEVEQHAKKLEVEITQRKQTEHELRQSERKFRKLAENIQEVFWIASVDFKQFIYVSPLYEKIWGQPAEILYKNSDEWIDSVAPEDKQFVSATFNKFLQGEKQIDIEYKIIRPDGTICWINNQGYLVFDEESATYSITGVAMDITERKELEELAFRHKYHLELAELSRVNSMGEMASTLAHELNQPLMAILTYSQACLRELQLDKPSIKDLLNGLNLVVQKAERAGTIIHRMKDFVRKGNLLLEYISINDLLFNLLPLMQYEGRNTAVAFNFDLAEELPLVYIDKIQIEQVVLNLARNAIEAMKDAKTVSPSVKIQTLLGQDNTITVNILDNGPGFPEEIASDLFSPYVTTKPRGTGMGLAISRTIIEAHGGQLSASHHSGVTCFQFILPTKAASRKLL